MGKSGNLCQINYNRRIALVKKNKASLYLPYRKPEDLEDISTEKLQEIMIE